jgi:hypothetical protein
VKSSSGIGTRLCLPLKRDDQRKSFCEYAVKLETDITNNVTCVIVNYLQFGFAKDFRFPCLTGLPTMCS